MQDAAVQRAMLNYRFTTMKSIHSVSLGLLASLSSMAVSAAGKPADFGDFWSVVPRRGNVNCVVKGVSARIYQLRIPKTNETYVDLCVVPSSLILTENGARAQFILAGKAGKGSDNSYASGFWEVNCRAMEKRTAEHWEFFEDRPESDHWNYKNFRYISYMNLWLAAEGMTEWSAWRPIEKILDIETWLCRQWRNARTSL
jgi:hypothetical protein